MNNNNNFIKGIPVNSERVFADKYHINILSVMDGFGLLGTLGLWYMF